MMQRNLHVSKPETLHISMILLRPHSIRIVDWINVILKWKFEMNEWIKPR